MATKNVVKQLRDVDALYDDLFKLPEYLDT
jgi:hypothetical protein